MKSLKSKVLTPTAPTTNVIVSVTTKYSKNISKLMALSAIQNGATVDPADAVNIVGTVVSLPKQLPTTVDFAGYSIKELQVGDKVIFSYKVIYDMAATETELPVHRNRLWYGDKEYFMADIRKIFGIIRGDEIIMINGYVMATEFEESKIILPQHMRRIKHAARAQVMHIGYPLETSQNIEAQMGDWVYFNPFVAQKYSIGDKKFIILSQRHILGKEADK